MNTQYTTTTVSLKMMPETLQAAIKTTGVNTKRKVRLVIVHDENYKVFVYDTQWSGGTRNEYRMNWFGSVEIRTLARTEGDYVNLQSRSSMVVLSHFCGTECNPTVYVRSGDLAAFYGCELGVELPGEYAADMLDERAEDMTGKEAKKFRKAAMTIRQLLSVGTFSK